MGSHRKKPAPLRYSFVTLGCPKNLVDSERMAGLLRRQGYRFTAKAENADIIVINTCGFVGDARAESYAVIEEMLARKEAGRLRGVIVAGCLAEREKTQLLDRYPAIDQLVGVFAREEIAAAANRIAISAAAPSCAAEPNAGREWFLPAPGRALPDDERVRLTPRHLAYLKIADGCNRLCSFCTIPSIRGRYVSKPMEQVLAEARQLAADGVRELILVAQDTTFYGIDLYGGPRLAELVRRLEEIDGLRWIRLMYLYPMHIDDDLIAAVAAGGKTLPYLDLPLQHIHDAVLERMRRRVSRGETIALLERLRAQIPRLALRTTFIVGFPGETEAQFADLVDFVRAQRFERMGVFSYCDEAGTPAAELDGKIDEPTRCRRREALMAVQQEIAFAANAAHVGRQVDMIVDRPAPEGDGLWVGRTWADAPEVDGAVYINGAGLAAGQIVRGEIVSASGYDLVAYVESGA